VAPRPARGKSGLDYRLAFVTVFLGEGCELANAQMAHAAAFRNTGHRAVSIGQAAREPFKATMRTKCRVEIAYPCAINGQ
jgi:hypothetical protein